MLHDISLGCAYLHESTILLYLGATGSAELMHQMTEAYWLFLVEIGLLDDSPDQNRDLLNLVPALCCVWKEHDWSYIIQHGLYGSGAQACCCCCRSTSSSSSKSSSEEEEETGTGSR
eukprot:COSAG06_NODE_2842_length_6173_cov_3.526013_7_plen_117_part_00